MTEGWLRIAAGFVVAGLIGAGAYFFPLLQTGVTTVSGTGAIPNPVVNPVSTEPFTVLLLGSDDDAKFPADRINTQSMILVRIDPSTKQATMLSIPRDLWVPIPGHGVGKIDTAYQLGGANLAMDTVRSNFQVHIDDYIWIGLQGLINLIDRMGGIDIIVTNPVMDDFYPADINTQDPYGYYRVAVLPGAVHLDGVHALQYVRSRHDDLRGDFGRSARQQQVLLAIRERAKQLNAADLPNLATAFNGEIKTTIGLDRLRALLGLSNELSGDGIHQQLLLPPYTSEAVVDGQDVVEPDWDRILPLVHRTFPQ